MAWAASHRPFLSGPQPELRSGSRRVRFPRSGSGCLRQPPWHAAPRGGSTSFAALTDRAAAPGAPSGLMDDSATAGWLAHGRTTMVSGGRDDLRDLDAAIVAEGRAPLRDVDSRIQAAGVDHDVTTQDTRRAELAGLANAVAVVGHSTAQLVEPLPPLGLLGVARDPAFPGLESEDKPG